MLLAEIIDQTIKDWKMNMTLIFPLDLKKIYENPEREEYSNSFSIFPLDIFKLICQFCLENNLKENFKISLVSKKWRWGVYSSADKTQLFILNLQRITAKNFYTPSKWKSLYSQLDQVLLEDPKVDLKAENHYALKNAITIRDEKRICDLVRTKRVDPCIDYKEKIYGGNHILEAVCSKGDEDLVKFLIEDSKIDPAANDDGALKSAVESENMKVIQLLFKDKRVNPFTSTRKVFESDAMSIAIRKINSNKIQRLEIVQLFLTHSDCSLLKTFKCAINNNKLDVIELLLKQSQDTLYPCYNEGITWAAANGHTEILKKLLEYRNVDPSYKDNAALKGAVRYQHLENINLLLNDPRINLSMESEQSISVLESLLTHISELQLKERHNHREMIQLLLKHPKVDPTLHRNKATRLAVWTGDIEVVKLFLADQRINPSDDNNISLKMAIIKNSLEISQLLVSHPRINLSIGFQDLMETAIDRDRLEIAKLLLKDPRIDPSDSNNYAIKMAIIKNSPEFVRLLLSHPRINLSLGAKGLIKMAIEHNCLEITELLLKDPRIDPSDNNNYAIKTAFLANSEKIISLLLTDPRVNPSVCPILHKIKTTYIYKDSFFKSIRLIVNDSRFKWPSVEEHKSAIEFAQKKEFKEIAELLNSLPAPTIQATENNDSLIILTSNQNNEMPIQGNIPLEIFSTNELSDQGENSKKTDEKIARSDSVTFPSTKPTHPFWKKIFWILNDFMKKIARIMKASSKFFKF
jgi:ankyrin repeat protein